MIGPTPHEREEERLKELASYSILDTLPESDFDNLTALAASICCTPISLISLIDGERQWFKSHHGLSVSETTKEFAFCAHAINSPLIVFEVNDARTDERFHDNPLVTGEPQVIFYAGVPLVSENGLPLGTICVIDNKPNQLSASQMKALNALSSQAMRLLALRKSKMQLEESLKQVEESNQNLERFAMIAAHDLKSPLKNIASLADLFSQNYKSQIDAEGLELIDLIQTSATNLKGMIEGLLDHSKNDGLSVDDKEWVNIQLLISEIVSLFNQESGLIVSLELSIDKIYVNRAVLYQILINLISNAIKYTDKNHAELTIGTVELESHYQFYVRDNGPGISTANQDKIFELFKVFALQDKYGQRGNGIGLATVKKLVNKIGGEVHVESKLGEGTTFWFTLAKA